MIVTLLLIQYNTILLLDFLTVFVSVSLVFVFVFQHYIRCMLAFFSKVCTSILLPFTFTLSDTL